MGDWLSGAESETMLAFELFSRGLAGRAEVYGVSAADVAEVARLVAAAGEAMAAANSPATRTPIAIAAKQQAFALSFNMAAYNQRLMKDYLALASRVPAYRLRYRRSFDVAEALFSAVEAHLQAELGLACAAVARD